MYSPSNDRRPLLASGDLLPNIVTPPPGPLSRKIFRDLDSYEAPGINTLVDGHGTLAWQEALGSNVLDPDGNTFLDLTSGFGVAAIGHRHPSVVSAISEQSNRLLHGLGDVHGHEPRAKLAAMISEMVPIDQAQVYFAISGSDAVEIALKTALLSTGKPGVLAFEPAYHGVTLGSLSATSRSSFRDPFSLHLHDHLYRLPFAAPPTDIEALLSQETSIGAVIFEPIAGREGVLLPPFGWLRSLAEVCRLRGALLIADEIFTGFGRTGYRFAVDAEEVRPDLLCCGKALGGGLPIAAAVGRKDLFASWARGGEALHTATFVANPLACTGALAALQVLEAEELFRRALVVGDSFGRNLERAFSDHPEVVEVRGRGFLWGIELTKPEYAKSWAQGALQRGLLVLAGGAQGTILQLAPPLSISKKQLDVAIKLLKETLTGLFL